LTAAAQRVRVEPLDGGPARFGILVEEAGRMLLALGATSAVELAEQLEACGGPIAYARRFGAEPLDPAGIAAAPDGTLTFVAPE
jgi:hypothetical protein